MRSQTANNGLLAQLLLRNSQYGGHALRYNHEATGLLLQGRNQSEWRLEQLYLAAGSEDLRALLPKLNLNTNSSEAVIVVRPYVHSMLIYFRREKDDLTIYIFESQAWALRYYPTRLILQALSAYYPDALIYLSTSKVQPQDEQEGCNEFVMHGIDFLTIHGAAQIQSLNAIPHQPIEDYPNCYFTVDDPCARFLCGLDKDLSRNQHRTLLENLLAKNYQQPTVKSSETKPTLDFEAIDKVTREMSGIDQPDLNYLRPSFCSIKVFPEESKVSLVFSDKDYLYSNCFLYSDVLYPGSLNGNLSSLRFVLQDHDGIHIVHDRENYTLHYYGKSIVQLQSAFEKLPLESQSLYRSHMRQQLALSVFSQQVVRSIQLESEVALTTRNGTGGLDIWQTQKALMHLLQRLSTVVYVPSWDEISGDAAKLNLNALRARGYACIVYAQQLNQEEHQVGVRVDLTSEIASAYIYNSYNSSHLSNAFKERQWTLLSETVDILAAPSFFFEQDDDWSCAIHVISNLLTACGVRDATMTPKLPVSELVRSYIGAWQTQEELDSRNAVAEFFHYMSQVIFHEQFNQFLRGQVVQVNKKNDVVKLMDSLPDLYRKNYADDSVGLLLLRYMAITYPIFNSSEFTQLIELSDDGGLSNDETDSFIALIETEFRLALNLSSNQSELCHTVLSIMLNAPTSFEAVEGFLKKIDCDYSLSGLQVKFICSHLLQYVCKETFELQAARSSELNWRLREERARKQQAWRCASEIGLRGKRAHEFVTQLLAKPRNIMIFTMPLVGTLLKWLESDEERYSAISLLQNCSSESPTALIKCCPEKYQMPMFKKLLIIHSRRTLNDAVAQISDQQVEEFSVDHFRIIKEYCDEGPWRPIKKLLGKFDTRLANLVLSALEGRVRDLSVSELISLLRSTAETQHVKIFSLFSSYGAIKNQVEIADILVASNPTAWPQFLDGLKNKLRGMAREGMDEIFSRLSAEQKLQFAICVKPYFDYMSLTYILQFLSATQQKELVLDGKEGFLPDAICLRYLLAYTDIEIRLELALKHRSLIVNMRDFAGILFRMRTDSSNSSYYLEFMIAFRDVMNANGGLNALLKYIEFPIDKEYFSRLYASCMQAQENLPKAESSPNRYNLFSSSERENGAQLKEINGTLNTAGDEVNKGAEVLSSEKNELHL